MIFQHNVLVPHRGGQWLSANIYRPPDSDSSPVPVISSLGPYNKERHTFESDPFESRLLSRQGPTVVYERFEGERWVEFGYAVVHLDTPGCGLSPGTIDVFSMRDLEYYYDAIEWIAKQPWCDGNVASCGLSYHSYTSIGVATLNPPSLKAIIAWEVGADIYHDLCYPGGIRNNNFFDWWFKSWVVSAQTGRSIRTNNDLAKDRVDLIALSKAHPHYDSFWRDRTLATTCITRRALIRPGMALGHGNPVRGHSVFRLIFPRRIHVVYYLRYLRDGLRYSAFVFNEHSPLAAAMTPRGEVEMRRSEHIRSGLEVAIRLIRRTCYISIPGLPVRAK